MPRVASRFGVRSSKPTSTRSSPNRCACSLFPTGAHSSRQVGLRSAMGGNVAGRCFMGRTTVTRARSRLRGNRFERLQARFWITSGLPTILSELERRSQFRFTSTSTCMRLMTTLEVQWSHSRQGAAFLIHACLGSTFEFRRKKLVGSYLFLRATKRE